MNKHLGEFARRIFRGGFDTLPERERRVVKHFIERASVSRNTNREFEDDRTIGQRVADRVAAFGGSWTFIIIFAAVLLSWVALNSYVLARRGGAFDPFPYILLNLFLSMLAAIQAPVIMMSQNRQDTKDRVRSELDFEVNRRSEFQIQGLAHKLNLVADKIDDVE